MFFLKKNIFEIFSNFFRFFFSRLGWTGELWLNGVVLILRNKEEFFFSRIFFSVKNLGFFKQNKGFLRFFDVFVFLDQF